MNTLLIPVDGSEASIRALQVGIDKAARAPGTTVHLLNVQPAIPASITDFVRAESVADLHRKEGEKALVRARALLASTKLDHRVAIEVGPVAETIADYARAQVCDAIVMGTRGLGRVAGLLLGSVTSKVISLVEVPVTLVK